MIQTLVKTIYAILCIVVIGFVVFGNCLSNGFVRDDYAQIVRAPLIHSVRAIPYLFISSSHHKGAEGFLFGFFYRPIPFSIYALIYSINQQAFAFHLVQLVFAISNACLVFVLLKKFLLPGIALFLSVLFLVHPINEEVIAYIANLQDILFFFFGMVAIYITTQRKQTIWHHMMSGLFLLSSLLSKETGILFFAIVWIYLLLYNKTLLKKTTLVMVSVLLAYFVLRINSSLFYFQQVTTILVHSSSYERLVSVPKVFFFYIHELFLPTRYFPSPNILPIQTITFSTFSLPLIVSMLFLALFLVLYLFVRRKKQARHFLFFFLWFSLGIGIHLQIFPLDQLVAKRWMYFPFVGLLGMFGTAVSLLPLKNKTIQAALGILGFIILVIFSLQTHYMNSFWKNQTTIIRQLKMY